MIAVDASALMSIVSNEEHADACAAALAVENRLLISACSVAEALIVAGRRNLCEPVSRLIDGLAFEIESVTPAVARRVAIAYSIYGKGIHPASLNFGDCFAYVLAKDRSCPLLFVGADFSRTDIQSALDRT